MWWSQLTISANWTASSSVQYLVLKNKWKTLYRDRLTYSRRHRKSNRFVKHCWVLTRNNILCPLKSFWLDENAQLGSLSFSLSFEGTGFSCLLLIILINFPPFLFFVHIKYDSCSLWYICSQDLYQEHPYRHKQTHLHTSNHTTHTRIFPSHFVWKRKLEVTLQNVR